MKLQDYLDKISDIDVKIGELNAELGKSIGYAKSIIQAAIDNLQSEKNELYALDLAPIPSIVDIELGVFSAPAIGDTAEILVTAQMSDASTQIVTRAHYAKAQFTDADLSYNNFGKMINVDVNAYTGANTELVITRTSNGWYISDRLYSIQGLEVNRLEDNKYRIVDKNGAYYGIKFETDGKEVAGDNWKLMIEQCSTGTTYATSDESVATVNVNGVVAAIDKGSATIVVTNGGLSKSIPVTIE